VISVEWPVVLWCFCLVWSDLLGWLLICSGLVLVGGGERERIFLKSIELNLLIKKKKGES